MTITKDPTAPLFAVVGSTGAQGGSTIQAIKESTRAYRVRAITRDTSKPASQALAKLGCELLQVDLDTKEGAEQAFKGADFVFGMTLTDLESKEKQYCQGILLADAAKAMNVRTYLWFGGINLTGGKNKYPLLEVKYEIADYARSIGLNTVDINPGMFMIGWLATYAPRKQEDGSFVLWLPLYKDTKMPLVDIEADYGNYVVSALETGRTAPVLASTEYLTSPEMAETISKVSGKKVSFKQAPDDEYIVALNTLGVPGLGEAIFNMMTGYREVGYYAHADLAESNSILKRSPRTFEQFLEAHKDELQKVLEGV